MQVHREDGGRASVRTLEGQRRFSCGSRVAVVNQVKLVMAKVYPDCVRVPIGV